MKNFKFSFLLMTLFEIAWIEARKTKYQCPQECQCLPNKKNRVGVTCRIPVNIGSLLINQTVVSLTLLNQNMTTIQTRLFKRFTSLRRLYVESSQVMKIQTMAFSGLRKLKLLSLKNNLLVGVPQGTFKGLKALRKLTLRNNDVITWNVQLAKELPNLRQLDIRGNKQLRLPREVLLNTTLDTITGATMKLCGTCDLHRSNQTWHLVKSNPKGPCQRIFISESKFTCFKNNITCVVPFSLSEVKWPYCLVHVLDLVPLEYLFGILAILSNVFVLLVTLSSRTLRVKVPFFLIANIAMADLLIGTYSVSVAAGHNYSTNSNIRKARTWRLTSCPYIRSILVLGEFVEVAASLTLSIERYIAIVWWKKPWLRMNINKASYIMTLCWVIAFGECLLLQLYNPNHITDSYMCILVRNIAISKESLVGQVFTGTLLLIYVFVIAFYVNIFNFLWTNRASARVKRESQMIRRIGAILVTNGLFFVGSNLLVLYMALNVPSGTLGSNSMLDFMVRLWLPPMCMVLNACLDPFFYAYKNTLFMSSLKKLNRSLRVKLARIHPKVDGVC